MDFSSKGFELGYRFWVLGLILFFSSPSFGVQCLPLFVRSDYESNPDIREVSSIMELVPTDRFIVFRENAEMSVYAYLSVAYRMHEIQMERFNRYEFKDIPPEVVNYYRELLQIKLTEHRRQLHGSRFNLKLRLYKLKHLIEPSKPEVQQIQSDVITYITQMNTILSEFIAVLHFPRVVSTEKTIEQIVGDWTHLNRKAYQHLTPEEVASLKVKMMDFVSRDENGFVWGEVKYLGRFKDYSKTSGHEVFTKMVNVKKLTAILPFKVRIVLAIAGPGRLTTNAILRYEQEGIEVIHLTPEWASTTPVATESVSGF